MRYTGTGIIVEKYKGNALFYKLKTKLPLETIQAVFTSAPELQKDIPVDGKPLAGGLEFIFS